MIRLVDIDPGNCRPGLKATEAQRTYTTNSAAGTVYEKFGFMETERDADEIFMERNL